MMSLSKDHLPEIIALMKRSLIWAFYGLFFGLSFGFLEMFFAYLDSLPDPFSSHDHWFDLFLILPGIFSFPGMMLNYIFFNPPDGNYGNEWEFGGPSIPLNAISWMIIFIVVLMILPMAKDLYQKMKILIGLKFHAR